MRDCNYYKKYVLNICNTNKKNFGIHINKGKLTKIIKYIVEANINSLKN